jgi:predicted nucleotide-binding protein
VPRDVLDQELSDRIEKGEQILEAVRMAASAPALAEARADFYNWHDYNKTLLQKRSTTAQLTDEYGRSWGGVVAMTAEEQHKELLRTIATRLRLLRSIHGRLSLFDEVQAPREAAREASAETERTTIFIVHGRNDSAKLAVHGFLRDVTPLQAIILHEQANAGRTIIEKFEDHAKDAAFAVVIMTADDVGTLKTEEVVERVPMKSRARQNVIFEFGFFVGAIGRNRVAILYEPEVERPSDIDGVAYIELDRGGAWKIHLARELKAAQLQVNPDKLL